MSSKKPTTRGIKNPQHDLYLQTVLKLARWQVGGGNSILRDLEPPEAESEQSEMKLLYLFMKYDYEKLILSLFRKFYKLSIDI